MLDYTCPLAALNTVAYNACRVLFGKDARFIFQRLDDANNVFANGVNGIELEASWTAPPDAADDTKTVVSPILEDVQWPEPDMLTDGENPDGAEIVVGSGPQHVTAVIRNPTKEEKIALRALAQEANLTVYRVDNNGNFGCRVVGSDHYGIKISTQTFAAKGPFKAGSSRGDQSKMMIQFALPENWFDTFAVVAPASTFDPLTEIVPS